MSVVQITLLIAATAASFASAQSQEEIDEYNVLVSDIKAHASDYLSIAINDPSISIPSGVLQIYQEVATATDDSYTTLYQDLDFNQISNLVVSLPWYSSRLEGELASATATDAASSSSDSAVSSTTSAAASSTDSATSSSDTDVSSTDTDVSSTESDTAASSTESVVSATESATAVSQVSDGQIQATQTANGAAKAAVGMGAGALAAAALLL